MHLLANLPKPSLPKQALALALSALLASAFSASVWADKPAHAGGPKSDRGGKHTEYQDTGQVREHALFSDDEREAIRKYYARHASESYPSDAYSAEQRPPQQLPPGLQKKLARGGELPPGWQKKLARGQRLSYDLRDASAPLPDRLREDLRYNDRAAEIIRIQDKIVKVSQGEGTIVDIIDLADVFLTP